MSDYKVDDFLIELGFSDNVTKKVIELEKKVTEAAKRIEKGLNKALNQDNSLNNLVKNTQTAAKRINQTLDNAFKDRTVTVKSKKVFLKDDSEKPIKKKAVYSRDYTKRIEDRADALKFSQVLQNLRKESPEGYKKYAEIIGKSLAVKAHYTQPDKANDVSGFTKEMRKLTFEARKSLEGIKQRSKLGVDNSDTATTKINSVSTSLNNLSNNSATALSGVSKLALGLGTATIAVGAFVSGLKSLADQSIEQGLRMSRPETASKVVFGEEDSIKVRGYAERATTSYGLDYGDQLEAYNKVAATSVKGIMGVEGVIDLVDNVSLAGKALGNTSEDIKGMLLAVSQMASKGKVSMEELRQQLGERLPIAFSLGAKAMGKTEQEFSKLVEDGKVLSSEFLPKFNQAIKTWLKDNNAISQITNSTQAKIDKAKATWSLALKGIFEESEKGYGDMWDSVGRLLVNNESLLRSLGKGFGWFFEKVSDGVSLLDDMSHRLQGFYLVSKGYVTDFVETFVKTLTTMRDKATEIGDQLYKALLKPFVDILEWALKKLQVNTPETVDKGMTPTGGLTGKADPFRSKFDKKPSIEPKEPTMGEWLGSVWGNLSKGLDNFSDNYKGLSTANLDYSSQSYYKPSPTQLGVTQSNLSIKPEPVKVVLEGTVKGDFSMDTSSISREVDFQIKQNSEATLHSYNLFTDD